MKKIIALLLAMAMMLSLVACGGKSQPETQPVAEPATQPVAAEGEAQ